MSKNTKIKQLHTFESEILALPLLQVFQNFSNQYAHLQEKLLPVTKYTIALLFNIQQLFHGHALDMRRYVLLTNKEHNTELALTNLMSNKKQNNCFIKLYKILNVWKFGASSATVEAMHFHIR